MTTRAGAGKRYGVVSHDGWGNTCVGDFNSLEEARELFGALCSDHWFLTDGSVKGVSIVDREAGDPGVPGTGEASIVASHRFGTG
ncbi:MAG: hypothetical protein AAFX65_07515 [Cyanobacteria bacterium J06638_7]